MLEGVNLFMRQKHGGVSDTRNALYDGEPAVAVDTEEEFARPLDSGVYVIPSSLEQDAMAWYDFQGLAHGFENKLQDLTGKCSMNL